MDINDSSLAGWQASLELNDRLCTTREQADTATNLLGWTVEEEIDAEHGLWKCVISQFALLQIEQAGYVVVIASEDRGHVARGEIEIP